MLRETEPHRVRKFPKLRDLGGDAGSLILFKQPLRAILTSGDRIFEEKASGGRWDRPQLHRALDQLRPGDVFVVWKLDRLSRSLKDLLTLMERIDAIGAGISQSHRSNRYDNTCGLHDDADGRQLC
jgi:hypothetical protein